MVHEVVSRNASMLDREWEEEVREKGKVFLETSGAIKKTKVSEFS